MLENTDYKGGGITKEYLQVHNKISEIHKKERLSRKDILEKTYFEKLGKVLRNHPQWSSFLAKWQTESQQLYLKTTSP